MLHVGPRVATNLDIYSPPQVESKTHTDIKHILVNFGLTLALTNWQSKGLYLNGDLCG